MDKFLGLDPGQLYVIFAVTLIVVFTSYVLWINRK